jgi:hypothetical protein
MTYKIFNLHYFLNVILCITVIFSLKQPASSESFFLKDGSILEGKTVKISDKKIDVRLTDSKNISILRDDILRTIFSEGYKARKFLYLKDGNEIEGFIVSEDITAYVFRKVLQSPEEIRIPKYAIKTISVEKLQIIDQQRNTKLNMSREEHIKINSSLIRFGAGIRAPFIADLYESNEGIKYPVNIDAFVYRVRDSSGNGLDFFGRYCFNNYDSGSISEDASYIQDRFGIDNISSSAVINSVDWDHYSFAAGVRYIHGFYLGGILWQGYAMAYYQYSWIQLHISGDNSLDKFYVYYSNGLVGGAGIEAGLFPHAGLFAEYTYGYSPAFPSNADTEGGVFRFGVTFRMENFF